MSSGDRPVTTAASVQAEVLREEEEEDEDEEGARNTASSGGARQTTEKTRELPLHVHGE